MSASTTTEGSDGHHQPQETVTQLSAESQESMLRRIEASTSSLERMLYKVVESQAHTQHQLLEILTTMNNGMTVLLEQKREFSAKADGSPEELIKGGQSSSSDHPKLQGPSSSRTLLTPEEHDVSIGTTLKLSKNLKKSFSVYEEMIHVPDHDEQEPPSSALYQQKQLSDLNGHQTNTDKKSKLKFGDDLQIRNYVRDGYELLYKAVIEDDWKTGRDILHGNQESVQEAITADSRTVLHIAIYNRRLKFAVEIVKLMPVEALQLKETSLFGRTALHVAAVYGNSEAAKLMVTKNPALTQIRDSRGRVPLELAIQHFTVGQKETVEYLYSVTRDEGQSPFCGSDGARLLSHAIDANLYDLALTLVERFPSLVIQETPETKLSGLEVMVQRPFAFLSGAKLTRWQQFIYSIIQPDNDSTYERITRGDEENPLERSKDPSAGGKGMMTKFILFHLISYLPQVSRHSPLYKQKLMHKQAFALVKYMVAELGKQMNRSELTSFFENSSVMKTAIQYGSTEFVKVCLKRYPILIWYEIEGETMIQMAIGERNEKILNLIWEACCAEDLSDLVSRTSSSGNTMLHYAAKLAPPAELNSVSGAALQMQRELQWFKGVESMVLEKDRFKRNKDGYTAQLIFTNEHKDLVEQGEKWMNVTSASCMLVGTLTATVAFSAAFTVPGGNLSEGNNEGTPVFLGKNSFMVFVAADALALFSSVTSVLMFLSILTSRYAEQDFLKSLPQKLILGLATLFISLATLLIAFGAALVLLLGEQFGWAPVLLSLCGSVPVLLFLFLQFPLFVEMVFSTYNPRILWKQRCHTRKQKVKKEKEN